MHVRANNFQELLEIALIPLLATLTVPLTWIEAYYTATCMLYVEAMGHSGIRCVSCPMPRIILPLNTRLQSVLDPSLPRNCPPSLQSGARDRRREFLKRSGST